MTRGCPPVLCEELGYNNGESNCPFRRVVFKGRKDSSDAFDVVQRSTSRIDIIIGHKTLHRIIDGVEKNKYYLYLTTPDGNSKKALYGAKDVPLRQIKLEDAVPAFTARKAYWLKMEPEIERSSPLSPTASPKP